ncbi:hypothetical protein D3C79_700580 [compost metagenome]
MAVAGRRFQCTIDQQARDVQARGAAVDLVTGDTPQVGHLRVGIEGRLLLGHRQYRAQVALAGGNPLGFEGLLNVLGPALTVLGLSG